MGLGSPGLGEGGLPAPPLVILSLLFKGMPSSGAMSSPVVSKVSWVHWCHFSLRSRTRPGELCVGCDSGWRRGSRDESHMSSAVDAFRDGHQGSAQVTRRAVPRDFM